MAHDMLPDPELLSHIGEHFAGGYFELPNASPMRRWSRALRRFLEHRVIPPFTGGPLYPCGSDLEASGGTILCPSYSYTWSYRDAEVDRRLPAASTAEAATLQALRTRMRALDGSFDDIRTAHVVGGRGYTHSIPNYGRVIREGLDQYAGRVNERLGDARRHSDSSRADFYEGLQDVLTGITAWLGRVKGMLGEATASDPLAACNLERLREAYRRVPAAPSLSFFEAMVVYNAVFYLDGCDNPGRVDLELTSFYESDLLHGATTHAEAVALLRALWGNVDANNGWSAGIGGGSPGGEANYTDLTLACLEAARGMRRPNLQLHVRRDMPQEVWDAAFETLASGCGLPALYHDEAFSQALQDAGLAVRAEDLAWRNGGGCTETMVHGRSNVGSLDAGINLPLILDQTLDETLRDARSFEEVLDRFLAGARTVVGEIVSQVSADQQKKALLRPQPMRSLLVDDCIDRGVEFNAGGARYNWSVVNVAGLANVVDALAALREVVFESQEVTAGAMHKLLASNFIGEEAMRLRLTRCPRYGNDDLRTDELAAAISTLVFSELLRHSPWRGGRFLPSCLMFVTYAAAGTTVGALPDGRRAGEPLADSAGPCQGRDTHGPTAMLRSVAHLAQRLAPGTLVVNMRVLPRLFATAEGRGKIRDLVRTYFDLGGMQLQINVVDQEILRDAVAHPERHRDLIVRIGGYSEYFNRLGPDLQATVLQRVEHGLG
jgi:formate C-acetyltransferase